MLSSCLGLSIFLTYDFIRVGITIYFIKRSGVGMTQLADHLREVDRQYQTSVKSGNYLKQVYTERFGKKARFMMRFIPIVIILTIAVLILDSRYISFAFSNFGSVGTIMQFAILIFLAFIVYNRSSIFIARLNQSAFEKYYQKNKERIEQEQKEYEQSKKYSLRQSIMIRGLISQGILEGILVVVVEKM